MERIYFNHPLDLKQVEITDAFWGREQELVRREVIPYQWEALNDRVPGAAPSYCMQNFKTAGRIMSKKRQQGSAFVAPSYSYRGFEALPEDKAAPDPDRFYGFVFQDSDFAKWIEAVGYALASHPDPELEKTADEAIDIVCAAQAENGYLDTYYIINGMDRIFTNLKDHHELYCFGHLAEGAVAYYQATGKDKLLQAVGRYADFIMEHFGPGEGQCKGYPGHEIAEMALARLYELTGEGKYLELSKFFLDRRGENPHYFDQEEKERAAYEGRPYKAPGDEERYTYYQAHLPVREQSEAVGHAVRAVYLYSGMADVARLTGDERLFDACGRLWDSIEREKLYVTGGIGGTHLGEAFSYPYDLPNDTAYSETCAAIGLVFFARRMLQMQPKACYGDVMEQALYNTVLAGMALDGRSFFYVNPLEVVPEASRKDGRKSHVQSTRQKWFGCACCPPNIARLVSSLGAYIYTQGQDTLYTHLYVGSQVEARIGGRMLDLNVESGFPWDGQVHVTLHVEESSGEMSSARLAFRIPGWCKWAQARICRQGETAWSGRYDREGGLSLLCGGEEGKVQDGYLYLASDWQDGDEIMLSFPMEVRMVQANTRVREDMGKVAFLRGPLCYCLEEADNGKDLQLLRVDMEKLFPEGHGTMTLDQETIVVEKTGELGHEMCLLKVPGKRQEESAPEEGLYREYRRQKEKSVSMTLVPYYAWNNRGEGEMSVWVRSE